MYNDKKNEEIFDKSVYEKQLISVKHWDTWSMMLLGEICPKWKNNNIIMPGKI